MFLDYFQLRAQPFGVTPDPAYLYPSRTHCQVLDSLTEGILDDRGFLALIAEPGMGKTTLLYQILERLKDKARVAFVFQTQCNSHDFVQYVLSDLGVNTSGMGLVAMHNALNDLLFSEMLAGKRFVLMVDEAQNLDDTLLETIRLLSNFETPHSKLLQIILAGQPELEGKLRRPQLGQLLQRINVIERLQALSPPETVGYINHRLKVAGHCQAALFDQQALALIAVLSQGVPRNINKLCYRALLEAYARKQPVVTGEMVETADRKLTAAEPAIGLMSMSAPAPAPAPARVDAQRIAGTTVKFRLRYRPLAESKVPLRSLLTGALAAAVLLAGLVTTPDWLPDPPRTTGTPTVAMDKSLQSDSPDPGRPTPGSRDIDTSQQTVGRPLTRPTIPIVTPIEAWNPADHSQVASFERQPMVADEGLRNARTASAEARASRESYLSLARELGLKVNRIAIDPGHGGFDTGTKGPRGLLEKDLCLDVALRLGTLIKEQLPDAQVIYTRKDDSYVPLEERTAIANSSGADLFISVHANSSESREVRGAETFYMSLNAPRESLQLAARENLMAQSSLSDLPELIRKLARKEKIAESKELAADIQSALSQGLQRVSRYETNRGVKQAPFVVLTGANMPAVLSEISFVSNSSDETLLFQSAQRQRVAEGLYHGVSAYLDSLHNLPEPAE
jgi:N-acetylmuramoyl-L-alanine amidase/type II secretory pathway predicted ATPase ExeA